MSLVFVVAPSGVCTPVSSRSGARVVGSALSCACLVPVRVASSRVRRSLAFLRRSRRARRLGWVRAVRFPLAPVGLVVPSVPVSGCGSALFLGSRGFLLPVVAGACPVSVALASFSRWSLRSAVLLCLLRVFSSPRVFGRVGSGAVPRPVLLRFALLAFRALGGGSGAVSLSRVAGLASSFPAPVVPAFPLVRAVSSGALSRAFSSLSGCLAWLLRRGGLCPFSLRPALASLLSVVCSLLS